MSRKIDPVQFWWLFVLALATSGIALAVDLLVFQIGKWKMPNRDSYTFWMVTGIIFVILAQACVKFISVKDRAKGSGIPEVKAVLSGVVLPNLLNWRTLVAKSLGMIFMLSSGMSLGKEGPFVHIAGCVAEIIKGPYG